MITFIMLVVDAYRQYRATFLADHFPIAKHKFY